MASHVPCCGVDNKKKYTVVALCDCILFLSTYILSFLDGVINAVIGVAVKIFCRGDRIMASGFICSLTKAGVASTALAMVAFGRILCIM